MKEKKTTHKLEYYVPESERTLRVLHLMFALADSPDRMSNIAQGLPVITAPQYCVKKALHLFEASSTIVIVGRQEAHSQSRRRRRQRNGVPIQELLRDQPCVPAFRETARQLDCLCWRAAKCPDEYRRLTYLRPNYAAEDSTH